MLKDSDVNRSIQTIIDELENLNRLKKIDEKRASECDRELNNFYHELEGKRFNAAEGYYLCKQLQDILIERRRIKLELGKINSMMCSQLSIKNELKRFNELQERIIGVERRYLSEYPYLANEQ